MTDKFVMTDWLLSIFVLLFLSVFFLLLKRFLKKRELYFFKVKDPQILRELIHKTSNIFLIILAIFIASSILDLSAKNHTLIYRAFFLVFILQIASWGNSLITSLLNFYAQTKLQNDAQKTTSLLALRFLVKAVFFSLMVLWGLDNLGVNITTLVAGLGVGGVAVALATQNILGDLFASLTIILDKPFVVGDSIVVGDFTGTIENIGLKTTRLRGLNGEQVIFSNADLLQSRIRNFERMQRRRIVLQLTVDYNTPIEKVEKINDLLKKIVVGKPNAEFDRVHLYSLNDSGILFELVYWMTNPDYVLGLDTKQSIQLEILKAFQSEKIELAYPTQQIVLRRTLHKND